MNSCSNSCSKKVPRLGGLGVGGWGFGYRVVKDIEVPPLDVGDRIVVDVGIRHGCCRRDERGGTGREGDCVFSDLLGCPEAGWCWLLPVGHRLFLGTSMAGRRAARGWQRWGGWGQWGKRNVTLSWNCVSLCTPLPAVRGMVLVRGQHPLQETPWAHENGGPGIVAVCVNHGLRRGRGCATPSDAGL